MIYIPKLCLTDPEGSFVSFGKNEFSGYAPDTDEVVFKALNDDFEVTLNGQKCEVRDCRVSAYPFNRPWPGKQRDFSQSEAAGYISFSADEAVCVRVKSKKELTGAFIRPLSKKIVPQKDGDELVFTLEKTGNYVLEIGSMHTVLHIFFNEIKNYPEKENATYYFGAGIHFPGNINLRDNDRVYVDPEAIVFGSICTTGAKNVHVFGGGVIDGCFEERITENPYENHTKGNIRLYNSENVRIEDVILKNSATWCLALFNCNNVQIDNVKIVGQWRYNTDGIDIVNSSNVQIKNSFIRSFDDTITIKGVYNYDGVIENITAENCVLWCGWGNTCEIGIETSVREYRSIVFKNCDVIHSSGPALSVCGGNQADIHDVLYSNINVEFSSEQQPEILQQSEAQIYQPNGKKATPYLININNTQYSLRQKSSKAVERAVPKKLGTIKNVRFENIQVFTDNKEITPVINVHCEGEDSNISNITVCNLYFNGEKQSDFCAFELRLYNFDACGLHQ